jgi:SWI/SNF-related matrix-associated actin-dependent regulator of chromatin subfamily A member 5
MLYRCRWCERASCEDCLDFDKTILIGDNLVEYDLLQFPAQTQAFYIQCPACTDHFVDNPKDKVICDDMARDMAIEHQRLFGAVDTLSQSGSLTDAATIDTTGANTPAVTDDDFVEVAGKKRKLKADAGKRSQKRMKPATLASAHMEPGQSFFE